MQYVRIRRLTWHGQNKLEQFLCVLDAVQAEAAAANKQLERSKRIVDFASRRVENLDKQVEAARKNKVVMDIICDVLTRN